MLVLACSRLLWCLFLIFESFHSVLVNSSCPSRFRLFEVVFMCSKRRKLVVGCCRLLCFGFFLVVKVLEGVFR